MPVHRPGRQEQVMPPSTQGVDASVVSDVIDAMPLGVAVKVADILRCGHDATIALAVVASLVRSGHVERLAVGTFRRVT
jgi:hypothetical protein